MSLTRVAFISRLDVGSIQRHGEPKVAAHLHLVPSLRMFECAPPFPMFHLKGGGIKNFRNTVSNKVSACAKV